MFSYDRHMYDLSLNFACPPYEGPSEASPGGLGGWPPRNKANEGGRCLVITVMYDLSINFDRLTYEGPREASQGGLGGDVRLNLQVRRTC